MTAELDAEVAERLMEWTRPPNKLPRDGWKDKSWPAPRLIHPCGLTVTIHEYRADKWWRAPDGSYHEHPPAYSTWTAVGQLWDKLHVDRYVLSVLNTIEPALPCHIEVNGYVANGEFCEALCQAALKAKEADYTAAVEPPLSVKQARELGVCRLCRKAFSLPVEDGETLVLDFGKEHAHRSCLDKLAAAESAKTNPRWCEWQGKCKEDTKKSWTCAAHMHEGRALQCPYKSLIDAQTRRYPCLEVRAIAAVEQPERPRLKWMSCNGGVQEWIAKSAMTGCHGDKLWCIRVTSDGEFRSWYSGNPNRSCRQPTFALAQVWCEEQEAKLLAEQEGKSNG